MITLYHGTSTRNLDDIIENGIKPRGESESVWSDNDCPSREDMVYLTNSYAPFFAQQSCLVEDGEYIDKPVVIEVSISDKQAKKRLYPDEDYLEQFTRDYPKDSINVVPKDYFSLNLADRTKFFRERLENYQGMWTYSLEGLGNVAFKGIVHPKFIKRCTILDEDMILDYSDPVICTAKQRIVGAKYHRVCSELIWSEPYSKKIMEVNNHA